MRFSAQLDFEIENETENAIIELSYAVSTLSPYLVWSEFDKGILNPAKFKYLLIKYGIFNVIFSGQTKYSQKIEYGLDKIAQRIDNKAILWAFFLMDKPQTYSQKIEQIRKHIDFPHNLANEIKEIVEIIYALDKLEYLEPKKQVKILESKFFGETIEAAQLYGGFENEISEILKTYKNTDAPKLIDGEKLLYLDKIEPTMFGSILTEIRLAQFRGEIENETQALEFAKKLVNEHKKDAK